MRIVVTTNNFWVGGRETYVGTWLDELAPDGVEAHLLASNIRSGVPGLHAFRSVEECGVGFREWLSRGGDLIQRTRPSVLWANHFDLFPAWLLSRLHNVPLITSFHGPLIGDARPNRLIQALGMTLAIHRGEVVTGVSEETIDGLRSLHGSASLRMLPNTVSMPDAPPDAPGTPPRRFVLLTRREKLEHIRQSALLFAAYSQQVSGCRLVIADGESGLPSEHAGSIRAALRQLGSRWSTAQGFTLLRALPRMKFIGWTAEARHLIRDSDVVLGMGRVVLEAISEGRPAVLVGYGALHGLMRPERFHDFRRSNFSGRGAPSRSRPEVVEELLALGRHGIPDLSAQIPAISAAAWAPVLRELIHEVSRQETSDSDLANRLAIIVRDGGGAEALFRIAVQSFAAQELETLYRLAEG